MLLLSSLEVFFREGSQEGGDTLLRVWSLGHF